jgi:ABC-type nitrate/sulfonate/bicarbonate transport system substrate-binding protein
MRVMQSTKTASAERRGPSGFRKYLPLLAVAALLTACGTSQGGSNSGTAAGSKLTIGYTTTVPDQSIPAVTQAAGLFRKYGVDVTLEEIQSSEINQALESNDIQLAVEAAPAPEVDTIGGTPILWIAQWEDAANLFLMGHPGVTSIKALAGKGVAVTAASTFTDVLATYALKEAGVSAKILPLGTPPNDFAAVRSGSASAAVLPPPLNVALVSADPGSRVLYNFGTSGLRWPGVGLVGTKSWLSGHAQLVEQVIKAVTAGIAYYKANPEQVMALEAERNGSTPSETEVAYDATKNLLINEPIPSLADQESLLKILALEGISGASSFDAANLQDSSYAEAALGMK